MRLKSLSYRNFTGTNADMWFAAITIITGDNGAGKTAVPTAIRLLFTGSLPPPIGVKGVYRYAGAPDQPGEMSVSGEMDNGRKASMKWTRNAKGSVSVEGGVPADLVMPPMLANPKSFWAKTNAERIQTIFQSCPGAGKDLQNNISARLGEVQVMPVAVRQQVLAWVQKDMENSFIAYTPQAACESLLDRCKVESKSAADKAKIASAAITAIALPASKPKDASAELTKLRDELVMIQVGAECDQSIHQTGLNQIRLKLEAYSRKYQSVPVEKLLEFIAHELGTIAVDVTKLKPPPPIDDVLEELNEAVSAQGEVQNKIGPTLNEIESLQSQIGDLEIATECPTCKSKAKGWKDKVISTFNAQIATLKSSITKYTAKKATLDASVIRLTEAFKATEKAIADHSDTKQTLDTEAQTLETDRDNITVLLQEQIDLQSKLAQVDKADAELPGKVKALQDKIAVLTQQQSLLDGYDRDMKARERLESELVSNQARADVLKAVTKLVTEEQAKASESAFGTVLGVARHFTDGLLNSPLEFVDGDLGRRVSKLDQKRVGFVAPIGSWITHETFSDSEQRIAYIGFATALAAEAPVKLVIIDELATLSDGRKILFVDRLIQLVRKGIIDQAICIEPGGDDYRGFEGEEEVRVIRL